MRAISNPVNSPLLLLAETYFLFAHGWADNDAVRGGRGEAGLVSRDPVEGVGRYRARIDD